MARGGSKKGLKRRRPQREPKRRFIVFCEGEKTEPAYFDAFRRTFPNALIEMETVAPAGVAYTVAKAAAERAKTLGLSPGSRKKKNSFEENDAVWAIFDRDEHPRYEEAIDICRRAKIGIGRSNPCFEVWLILHEADYNKSDGRDGVQAHLKKLRPEYDKTGAKTPDCADLVKRVGDAEQRAERQLARRAKEGSAYDPPSTTVFHLTRAIRAAAESAKRE